MDEASRHVTFNDTNTSSSKGRVRKEQGLYRLNKICKTILFSGELSAQSAFTMWNVELCSKFLAVHLFSFELSQKGEGGEEDEEGQSSC